LRDPLTADLIARARVTLESATTIAAIRQFEARAAYAYWSAWRTVPVIFPMRDIPRVPDHWRIFGSRQSPLTGSPRLAVNPPNAILNYLYALLESESRLALAALGLDPGIGVLHVDTPARDSLACDLMEAVRPRVDAYLLDWLTSEPVRREWFFEKRNGNCRLMGSFAVRLSETAPTWSHAVAPIAEWISRTLWTTLPKPARQLLPASRLTQNRRRQVRGKSIEMPEKTAPQPPRLCRNCGATLNRGKVNRASCAVVISRQGLIEAARLGRIATHSPEAEILRATTMRRQEAAKRAWQPTELPGWLNEKCYRKKIQPRLWSITVPAIATALGISEPYAADIRKGRRVPHPRHWVGLARIVEVSCSDR
jgi:hypothetical protein